ncbi:MAG: hypothetical protein HN391_00055 [Anaerolineae bacterium]|nr:hypothetical protein [Anaerolineae bacterium]
MRKTNLFLGLSLLLAAILLVGCEAPATLTVVPSPVSEEAAPAPEETPAPEVEAESQDMSGAAAKAVDLIGAWAEAGASETEAFDYTGVDGNTYQGSFEVDVLPLFTENNLWFDGAQACSGCHFANSENSYHEMDLSSYAGLMLGGDVLSQPPGVPLFGESEISATDFDWDHSKLRGRLRNNRMPPGWEFDITEENRDGLCVEVSADGVSVLPGEYGCELNGVGVIAAWVDGGAPETDSFDYGDAQLNFERDVLPFVTEADMWFDGSQSCTGCHFANSESSYHEMDLSSYEGLMAGGDVLSSPPGVPLFGQSAVGETDYDWDHSKLKERLRNNRMAPGWDFDITEENRDGPLVLHGEAISTEEAASLPGSGECKVKAVDLIGEWTAAGASESGTFEFTDDDGAYCEGTFEADVLPLFTENNLWFDGAQACSGCHFANSENSYHEMDLSSYAGLMLGGDVLSQPPGVPLFGESEISATDFDWDHSKLRGRLRNNRMPPGWEFDITEENRDGLCVEVSADGVSVLPGEYGCELNGVGVIAAWVDGGAPETDSFDYGDAQLNFERDVLPFVTEADMWFDGSQSCTGCHFANSESSYHEMDLSSYEGLMAGGDVLSSPPGVPLFGQSAVGETDYDWDHSKLKERLRNNRMAPGWDFDITEENRDGPMILAGTKQ